MARHPPKQAAEKARMTRKRPAASVPGRRAEDPKAAYTCQQLAEVGAVVLIWNQVDAFVDWLLHMALRPPHEMISELGRRISLDGKLDILRVRAERSKLFNDDARGCIKYSLDAVKEYGTLRNRIAHSISFDPDQGIAEMVDRRAEPHQVLVTMDALSALYQRMKLLLNELLEIDLLYRLADERSARADYRGKERDPLERRRLRDVPLQIVRVLESQKARRSLAPLPLFPDEPPAPPA